ncbi:MULTISPECIES: MFS transporter [unclassified Herbaspirillum]|uniref:MFS transporter n=1 Tax=unclassified Herbaspirillum TaxID=2624150 RepID=UPI00115473F5|nr:MULTISPECIES: MFS transporter [unclassified Herbaspirillum]MBB5393533.1 sugar phosphate permease [Herbaspirillum sp. SJZ102]TQK03719.1 sugar phosphate permease [Herbaspirillum sp. SJZ130]TQK08451.1 sugar phosphate permease [Herbaspirillum sp. SJZ106]
MNQPLADAAASTASTPARPTRFRWVVAGLIFLIYTIAAADRANIGVALPFIRKEFAMSNTEAGALLSLFLFAYALAQLPSGFATSRFGVRRIFSGAMILTSVFTGMIGTTTSILGLKIYRFALGLAEGPLPVGIAATINNWFPPHEKGTASGIFLSAVKFGPVIVPPICAAIIAMWGWREIFIFFAVPGIIFSIIWFFLVTNHPSQSKHVSAAELDYITGALAQAQQQAAAAAARQAAPAWLDKFVRARKLAPLTDSKSVFRSWNVLGCALGYCFQLGISNVLLAWIPTYLLSVKKFSVMNMGFVAAAPWVGAVIGNLLGGLVSDRLLAKRRKPGMMLSALATAGMMYALINSPADPVGYGLLLFATGVLLSFGFSAYMAYPMGVADKKTFPIASSVVNMGGQIGGAIAPLATGMLLDSYGWDYVFAFMAIGSLASFVVLLTIAEPVEA